ncbi:toprim domain-containing protein [Cognatishimia sp. F0-27]|uniref:DUF7146 domain-containing protein n=1 Tax=Cognatishimia sp. F0-27 TaxID=2816855 RepID=UPI001D0CAD9B|nr:toprim domain-containing protein [Cognatishimia sp. F0-27]MCC1493699.1 toprim domain-containing protein [Cognatishimia sp. F0-27]
MSEARDLTQTLGGKWYHRYGVASCPVCQPQRDKDQTALTLADGRNGRLVLNCKKSACAFLDILAAAGLRPGDYCPPDAATLAKRDAEQRAEAAKRAAQAKRAWDDAVPVNGTPAETYLRKARGITCPLPDTLRFHPACWHGPTAKRHPAMVALVEGGDGMAVHRTYLRADGSGKAEVDPAKMMLGTTAGGAVRITDAPGPLAVAEGVETALSLASGLLRGPASAWAALSTSGIRALRLPDPPGRLILAPDGDKAGRDAANVLAMRAHALGWTVSLLPAPDGRDWNDILTMKRETT